MDKWFWIFFAVLIVCYTAYKIAEVIVTGQPSNF